MFVSFTRWQRIDRFRWTRHEIADDGYPGFVMSESSEPVLVGRLGRMQHCAHCAPSHRQPLTVLAVVVAPHPHPSIPECCMLACGGKAQTVNRWDVTCVGNDR